MAKDNKRIPRKKGQPVGSKKHSDLYTDENPKGTIRGLKFTTVADARSSVAKIKRSNRTHAHKTQAAIAMEQRARGRQAIVRISTSTAGTNWRLGSFRMDVMQDGKR